MNIQLTKKETIFSDWDATDEEIKQLIFDEFKIKHKGCYTEKDLLNFLEKKLLRPPEPLANA